MPVLNVLNLSKDFRHKPLFDAVTFGLDWKDRMGVIGVNGSGKTTLLRIIAGDETPDAGEVTLADGATIGYLPQNPKFDPEMTVLEALYRAESQAMQLLFAYEAACNALAENHEDMQAMKQMSELSQKLDAANAWELETQAHAILHRLGIVDTKAKMGTLSGGQVKRVALAHALIVRPDLLILDEPTNHLDAETIDWLEEYLSRYTGALLLVTHDRYFLDRVTTHILEIDRGTSTTYHGTYSDYLEKKEAEDVQRRTENDKRRQLVKRELLWLRRGAKARTTKQKARVQRAEELIGTPEERDRDEIKISAPKRRLGTKVIVFDKTSKQYGDLVLVKDLSYSITRGERLGIIGPNGAGKTSLLDMVSGRITADSGAVEIGPTVVIGYYDQQSRQLNDELSIIDYIREAGENILTADGTTISASQMLERFLFPPASQRAKIATLSGGERRRLYLLRILMQAPNVLLLDEPTNDLDIPTLVALEEYLDDFNGSVIVVSHDRYFLDRVVDHIFRFEGAGAIREYPGNYSAYIEITEREQEEKDAIEQEKKLRAKQLAATPVVVQAQTNQRKLSFKEKKELDSLEGEIATLEARKLEIEKLLADAANDYPKIAMLSAEFEAAGDRLEVAVTRWTELAEFA